MLSEPSLVSCDEWWVSQFYGQYSPDYLGWKRTIFYGGMDGNLQTTFRLATTGLFSLEMAFSKVCVFLRESQALSGLFIGIGSIVH